MLKYSEKNCGNRSSRVEMTSLQYTFPSYGEQLLYEIQYEKV